MTNEYFPNQSKISAMKGAQREKKLIERYKLLMDEIIQSRSLTDAGISELVLYNNQKLVDRAGKLPQKHVKFDPQTPEPKGTLNNILAVIEKILLQYQDEIKHRQEGKPLTVEEVINIIMKKTDLEVTQNEVGGMQTSEFKNRIQQINEADEGRRAREKGLEFDDSDLVAEAAAQQTADVEKLPEINTKPTRIPHPPSSSIPKSSPHSAASYKLPNITKNQADKPNDENTTFKPK